MRPFSFRWLGGLFLLLLFGFAGVAVLKLGEFPLEEMEGSGNAALLLTAIPESGVGEESPLPTVTSTPITPTPAEVYVIATAYVVATPRPEWYTTPTATQPPPAPTPLPTVSAENRSPYAAHNLVLIPGPTPVSPRLREQNTHILGSRLDWSPDGSLLAFTQEIGETQFYPNQEGGGTYWSPRTVYLFDSTGQDIGPLVGGEEPLWSPTGAYLAVSEWNFDRMEGSVKVVELSTHRVSIAASLTAQHSHVLTTWISNIELAFNLGSQGKAELLVFNVVSGQLIPLLNDAIKKEIDQDAPGENLRVISSLPTKGLIAIWTRAIVFILRRDETGLWIVRKLKTFAATPPVFAPDGDAIGLVAEGGSVQIVSMRDPDQPTVFLPVGYKAWPLIWSPDGSSLVFSDPGGWYIVNRDGSGLRLFSELPADTYHVMWTMQGVWAVHGNGAEFVQLSLAPPQ